MSRSDSSPLPSRIVPEASDRRTGLGLVMVTLLVLAALLTAYANAWNVPFIFDDLTAIRANASIRDLSQPATVLFPPTATGDTVEGRPILNLSFALNYAISGTAVWSYHAFNLGIHFINALLLLGIVRRTWPRLEPQPARRQFILLVSGGLALVWALHPLQTASVTYLSRRVESLAALFLLLTLYAFIRGATMRQDESVTEAPRMQRRAPIVWFGVAIAACLLGVATKEVAAAAPLVIFLYDRTFLAGSWARAWRERSSVYLGLAATWIALAILILLSPDRGGTAGFGTGVSPWHYLLTQCTALVHYLRLAIWPQPLVFDYGNALVTSPGQVGLQGIAVVTLLVLTVLALRFRPVLGFFGAVFFLLLAPSSSVIPIATQTIAEHRMYLPLFPVLAVAALGLTRINRTAALLVLPLAALVGGGLTFARNTYYRSEVSIWADTVAKRQDNARAHNNLGNALIRAGRAAEALPQFAAAVQLDPTSAESRSNLATALARDGQAAEALDHFAAATALAPAVPEIHYGFGMALLRAGRVNAGRDELRQAMALDPTNAEIPYQLANALALTESTTEARALYEKALALDPNHAAAHNHLGLLIAQSGGLEASIPQFEAALRIRADYPEAHANLGNALLRLGRTGRAIPHLEAALRLRPDMRGVREALEQARRNQ